MAEFLPGYNTLQHRAKIAYGRIFARLHPLLMFNFQSKTEIQTL